MGMYDSVMVACPKCTKNVEFQSKEGECACDFFTLETAPAEILFDIMNEPHYCQSCGQWFALIDPAYPPQRSRPRLESAKVKTPDKPGEHHQGFKWWPSDHEFTYADLEPS